MYMGCSAGTPPFWKQQLVMSIRKDVARVVRLKEFHSRVEQLLTPADRDYFFYALKEYNTYKSVAKLMLALNSCLDTPEKLDLLPSIRDLIPRHDRKKFDNLAPYNRMAHPLVPTAATSTPTEGNGETQGGVEVVGRGEKSTAPGIMLGAVKVVFLQRSKGESLGFSIRGGREHDLGIFISHIDSFSLAEKSGLLAGDKIVSVNGVGFESITHQSAVLILKSHNQLQISVVSVGHIPGRPGERKSLIWVDTSGKPVDEQQTAELSISIEEDHTGGDRLLASPDRHKVVLRVEKQQPLGFSVRGGKEFSLGIFISQVEQDTPAEQFGLKPGDQIVDVNGHSFLSIQHQEAVTILKTYTTLIMTVRSLGRLPMLVSEDKEEVDGPMTTSPTPTTPHEPSPVPQSPSSQPQQAHSGDRHQSGHAHKTGHTHTSTTQQKRWRNWKKSVARRSQSVREFLRPRSLYASHPHQFHHHHYHHLQSHPHQHPPRHSYLDLAPRSRLRTGSDSALTRHSKLRGTPHSSPPLIVAPQKASSSSGTSPTTLNAPQSDQTKPKQVTTSSSDTPKESYNIPITMETGVGSRERVPGDGGGMFFRYGVGTQLMLATASSRAKSLLEDSARRCLDAEEMAALTERLREYESNGEVETFAEFLVSLLDTPRKMQLLSDIRSVLNPTDLVTFDRIVSPHEIAALQKRACLSGRENQEAAGLSVGENTTPRELSREADLSIRDTESPESGLELSPPCRRRVNVSVTFDQEVQVLGREKNASGDANSSSRGSQRENLPGKCGQELERGGRGSGRSVTLTNQDSHGEPPSVPVVQDSLPLERLQEDEGREVVSMGGGRVGNFGSGELERIEEEEEEERDEGDGDRGGEGGETDEDTVQEEQGDEPSLEPEQEEAQDDLEEREGDEMAENRAPSITQDNYNLVLYEIQNHQGQGSLRRAEVRAGDMGSPHIGAFGTEPASDLLSRATDEEPSMLGMQTRESFLEWNDDYTTDSQEHNRGHTPSRNPVIIEIVKSAPQLGLTITGGVDTPSPGVIITDVKEGGAAGNDGFLQPGFEIVQVDGVRIRGLSHDSAARALAGAFRSERPTIELIVIPN